MSLLKTRNHHPYAYGVLAHAWRADGSVLRIEREFSTARERRGALRRLRRFGARILATWIRT